MASIRLLYSVHIGFADAECVCVRARCMGVYLIQNRGTRWWSGHGCTALQRSFWLFPLCCASPFQFVSGANTCCITQLSACFNGQWYLQCKRVLGLLGDVDTVLCLSAWKLCFWQCFLLRCFIFSLWLTQPPYQCCKIVGMTVMHLLSALDK